MLQKGFWTGLHKLQLFSASTCQVLKGKGPVFIGVSLGVAPVAYYFPVSGPSGSCFRTSGWTQLVKGEILQYSKSLNAIKNNCVLVEQSVHSVLLGDDDLKYTWQPGHFVYWKETPPEELSSTSLERPLWCTVNQPLCHQTPRRRLLDSHDTYKNVPNPD